MVVVTSPVAGAVELLLEFLRGLHDTSVTGSPLLLMGTVATDILLLLTDDPW